MEKKDIFSFFYLLPHIFRKLNMFLENLFGFVVSSCWTTLWELIDFCSLFNERYPLGFLPFVGK